MAHSEFGTRLEVVTLGNPQEASEGEATDGLDAFHSEVVTDLPAPARSSSPGISEPPLVWLTEAIPDAQGNRINSRFAVRGWVVAVLAVVAVVEAPFAALWFHRQTAAPASHGTVYVESDPSGSEVLVDGRVVGRTPARLLIPRGQTALEFRHAGLVRTLPLTVVPEEVLRLRVELPADAGQSARLQSSGALDTAANLTVPQGSASAGNNQP
jgi:hypothetical protein